MEQCMTTPLAAGGRILIVDDDPIVAGMLGMTLGEAGHEVVEVDSGEAALAYLESCGDSLERLPEVVFLDIEMTGMDGYTTCRRLREKTVLHELPVVFLSGHDELEDRLQAYDAGGSDFVSKPFVPDEILRKAEVSIRHRRRQLETSGEERSAFGAAMTAMTTLGESGVSLIFCRAALGCRTHHSLGMQIIDSMSNFDLECQVQIRPGIVDAITLTRNGAASPLEESVFEKMQAMGRIFSFKNRMVINYERVSLLVPNMPLTDEDLCGRIRDHAATIAEAAELAVGNINLRIEANQRSESLAKLADASRQAVEELRGGYREMQIASRLELDQMTTSIEGMYIHLGLTNKQEFTISDTVRDSVERVLSIYDRSSDLDDTFGFIIEGLTKASEHTVSQEDDAPLTIEFW